MKSVNGVWLPDGDDHFVHHLEKGPLFNGKPTYQLSKIEKALAITKGRRLAIDIGAHVGLWSMVLASYFRHVIAFEPMPEHLECLRENIKGRGDVVVHAFALSDKAGTLRMNPAGENSGNAHVAADGKYIAQAVRLDTFNFTGIDLIKIDVEGFEDFIVRGGEETIKREKPAIVVEQKPGHAERYGLGQIDAVETLKSWGAEVAWIKSGDYGLRWQR